MPLKSCRFWIRICRIFTFGGKKNLGRPQRLCSAVTRTIHPTAIEYTYFVAQIFSGNSTRCEKTLDRDRLYQLYRDDLTARKLTYGVIEGQAGRRLDCALEFLQQQGIELF